MVKKTLTFSERIEKSVETYNKRQVKNAIAFAEAQKRQGKTGSVSIFDL